MNILLALILLCNLAVLAVFILFLVRVRGVYRDIVAYITPQGEGEPSPLARTVEAAGDMLARSLVAQAKGAFMGKQSAAVRGETAIAGDIAEDLLAQRSPVISAILQSFPTLKKTIRRNPQLLDIALSKLAGGLGSGGSPAPGPDNGNTHQLDFKL